MQNPDWLQQVLDSFDSRTEPFMEVALADALRAARNTQGDLDDASRSAFLAEHSAFMFLEKPNEDSLWGTYFAPMAECTTSDGGRTVQPDVAKLNQETVQHWAERTRTVQHPILRARYADCVWDLEHVITKSTRRYDFAILAAQSYIETAKRNGFSSEITSVAELPRALNITGVQMLARAVQLARSIKSPELANEAASELISFCGRHGDPAHAVIWLAPFDALYREKDLFTTDQEAGIISDLEAMLQRTSSSEGGKDFNPFGAQSAAERLIKHYDKPEQTQRLVQAYGSAFENMAREASPMLAMAWLQPVIERYQQAKLTSESERLANIAAEKGRRMGEDLKTYSVGVPFEREAIDNWIDDLLAGNQLHRKLYQIGRQFIPKLSEVKESLKSAWENAPLLCMIGEHIITPDGQTTARIGSVDEDMEGRLRRQTADNLGLYQVFLSRTLSELKRRDDPTAEQIVEVLYECPLFNGRRKPLIREGFAAYLAEDWVKAIHVLVPQLEEILRSLLAELRIPVTKSVRNNPGVTELKNMGDVLSDDRIKSVLGEDMWRYLTALYTDRRGINLRNNIAHGLVGPEGFNTYIAGLVFHSFLAISLLGKAS